MHICYFLNIKIILNRKFLQWSNNKIIATISQMLTAYERHIRYFTKLSPIPQASFVMQDPSNFTDEKSENENE